jgi:hypothetical protein
MYPDDTGILGTGSLVFNFRFRQPNLNGFNLGDFHRLSPYLRVVFSV